MNARKLVAWSLGLTAVGAMAQDLVALNREMQSCVVQVHVQGSVREKPPLTPAAKQADDFMRRFIPRRERSSELAHPRGLGLLWSDGRHVLSLGHLLGDDEPALIAVQNEAGQWVAAESLGVDPLSGAWLLRLREALPNPPCRFGSAKGLQPGQELFGIGNLMNLQRSLQRGIVAGLGRESGDGGRDLGEPLIQTDFRSARGMAGGPLFDAQGRVLGLHDMMLAQGGQDLAALARPIDELLIGAQALKAGQPRQPSRIGLEMGDGADDSEDAQALAQRWLAGPAPGVGVLAVTPDGPADRAGLRAGDRILALGGQRVDSPPELARRVARLPVGQAVLLAVRRAGQSLGLRVLPEAKQPAP